MPAHVPHAISTSQLARALGVDPRTLRRWIASGTVAAPGHTDGGHRRWDVAVAAAEVRRRGLTPPASWGIVGAQAA